LEDGLGFTKIATVSTDYLKDLERIVESVGLFEVSLFDLVVKEPFVNLNPSESGFFDGLVLHLFCQFSIVLIENFDEDPNLIVGFASSVIFDAVFVRPEFLAASFAGYLNCLRLFTERISARFM
jgi:hypothetical protein